MSLEIRQNDVGFVTNSVGRRQQCRNCDYVEADRTSLESCVSTADDLCKPSSTVSLRWHGYTNRRRDGDCFVKRTPRKSNCTTWNTSSTTKMNDGLFSIFTRMTPFATRSTSQQDLWPQAAPTVHGRSCGDRIQVHGKLCGHNVESQPCAVFCYALRG